MRRYASFILFVVKEEAKLPLLVLAIHGRKVCIKAPCLQHIPDSFALLYCKMRRDQTLSSFVQQARKLEAFNRRMKGRLAEISTVADKYREDIHVLDESLLEMGAECEALCSEIVLLKARGPTSST